MWLPFVSLLYLALVRDDKIVKLSDLAGFLESVELLAQYFDPATGSEVHSACPVSPGKWCLDVDGCLVQSYIRSNQSFYIDVVACDFVATLLGQSLACSL